MNKITNWAVNGQMDSKSLYKSLIFSGLAIAILMIFYISVMYALNWDMPKRGQFGDMFAVLNTFFSGVGFFLLFMTVMLQMQQIQNQEKEIKETQIEQKRQTENVQKQQFEAAFFNLLQLHGDIVKDIDIKKDPSPFSRRDSNAVQSYTIYGRDCFKFFYENFSGWHRADKKSLNETYSDFFQKYQSDLGHYFRTLYQLIKFVHLSDISDKKRYVSIIRAQLSSYELLMLFYNGVSKYGNEKFKPLIEEYQLFKNIPDELLDEAHYDLYGNGAYENLSELNNSQYP